MSIILRDYQQRAVDELKATLRTKKKVVLTLPTGGGKGVLVGHILHAAWAKGRRIMATAHREEILDQICGHLDVFGVPHGMIQAGEKPSPEHPVQVASIQTLARRMDRLPAIDILLMDEVHHANSRTWKAIIDAYPDTLIVGFSATPTRLDGQGLGSVGFEALIEVATVSDLISGGYLVPPVCWCPPGPSFRKVAVVAGDYNRHQAAALMDRPQITGDIVQHWLKLAPGQPTLCFSTGLTHSKNLVEAFRAAGVTAEDVDAGSKDRAAVLARFSSGETTVVVNCGLFLEGVDLPICSCVVHARPTMSPSLAIQITGRALRTHPGKSTATIIDAVGNIPRHGLPTEDRKYSLLGREVRSKEKAESTTVCHKCFSVYSSKLETCPNPTCGEPRRHKPRAPIKTVDGELVEAGKLALAQWGRHVPQEERIAFLTEKMKVAKEREYKIAWASLAYQRKFGFWPLPGEERRAKEKCFEF